MTRAGRRTGVPPSRGKAVVKPPKLVIVPGLLVVLLGLLGVLAAGLLAAYDLAGHRLYAVQTGSMVPAHLPGDLVVAAPPADIALGDVLTFRSGGGGLTTHRVMAVNGDQLTMKGDANETADPVPVPRAAVVGEVVQGVPNGGYALVFLQQPAGILGIMTLVTSVILAWGLFFPTRHA